MNVRYLLVLLTSLTKEAASHGQACTAAMALQPTFPPDQGSGENNDYLVQGQPVKVKVYAVNDCIDEQRNSVKARLLGRGDDEPGKGGRFCIKPAAIKNDITYAYDPKPEYFDPESVRFSFDDADDSDWQSHFKLPEHPPRDADGWKLSKGQFEWCAACITEDSGCYELEIKRGPREDKHKYDIDLPDDKESHYLFTITFTLTETISAQMALNNDIVFQAQVAPTEVQIHDERCQGWPDHQNEGGGQGTVPYHFLHATTTTLTTTTVCEFPCCRELRVFMDNVKDYMQEKFEYDVMGNGWDRSETCTHSCSAPDNECVNEWEMTATHSEAAGSSPRTSSPRATEESHNIADLQSTVAELEKKIKDLDGKGSNIALMVVVSVLCAVMVQVIAGVFGVFGGQPVGQERPLLG